MNNRSELCPQVQLGKLSHAIEFNLFLPRRHPLACSLGKFDLTAEQRPEAMKTMPCSRTTLTLSDAKRMLEADEAKAASFGIAYNIAVVDDGGALVAFARQDGALIGSIDLAISRAVTARLFDKTTAYLSELAQPGAPLFGIEQSNGGRVIIFGGGIPVRIDGEIIGAVGASAGTVEQDISVAEAAIAALDSANA